MESHAIVSKCPVVARLGISLGHNTINTESLQPS